MTSATAAFGSTRRAWFVRIGSAVGAVALMATTATSALAQQRVWSHEGARAADFLGVAVTDVGDFDGDGVSDFVVGAPGSAYAVVGKVRIYSGATLALIREFHGDADNDTFGYTLADLGDVDGDGVHDFAIGAPDRNLANLPIGAIFVVSGATGATIRTITSSAPNGGVGLSVSYVGDLDGDGVRDLVYTDNTGFNSTTVFVVSGATGASIRSHVLSTDYNNVSVSHAGDVDADGVDDYMVTDFFGSTLVFSGASGAQLYSFSSLGGPAGDVDLDGHADVMLFDNFNGTVHVVSGATGLNLYDLVHPGFGGWYSANAAGDFDGDGHPDLVASDGITAYLFSGKDGSEIRHFADPGIVYLDASTDLTGDGVPDLVVGNPYTPNAGVWAGSVIEVSGADGSTLGQANGDAFLAEYGCSMTLVNDRDGDGWRDVAVVVPGGLETDAPNLVQIVSGRDGHEISRFHTASGVHDHDREIVSVGDVNGDGIVDVAVAAPNGAPFSPPANAVEIHSGADDSLITTLVTPSGTPEDLAAAADVNGTPLLAVATHGPDHVYVYDLATNLVVTDWSNKGDRMVACVGDVNGDGTVDWVVRDPHNFGTAYVFAGGAAPKTIWKLVGTSSSPVDVVTSTGDLDGDGLDDVLVGNLADNAGSGKVTAYSGVNGAKIFEIKGTQSPENFGYKLQTLGDVNRDGVCDFAVGAQNYDSGTSPIGAVFVYSGKTATLLYRFDATNGGDYSFVPLCRNRWHDDPRVDGDKSPDLVVGSPNHEFGDGLVELDRLDDLMLQVDPPSPLAGTTVTATTRGGPSGNLVGLYAIDLSGSPLNYFLAIGTFNSKGNFAVTDSVPSSMQGLTLDVISYGVGFNGKLADSELTAIVVQ